jgi:hypothetical protein
VIFIDCKDSRTDRTKNPSQEWRGSVKIKVVLPETGKTKSNLYSQAPGNIDSSLVTLAGSGRRVADGSSHLTNANGKSRTLSVYKDEGRDESAARK